MKRVFNNSFGGNGLNARLTVTHDGTEHVYSNLFIVSIEIENSGIQDRPSFPFAITLSPADKAIWLECKTADHLHQLISQVDVSPDKPVATIDLKAIPFNREDTYLITLYIVIPTGSESPGPVRLVTAEPVRFVPMIGLTDMTYAAIEMIAEIMTVTKLPLSGLLRITVPRRKRMQ